jgi:hypothetical protein
MRHGRLGLGRCGDEVLASGVARWGFCRVFSLLGGPGGDLLSHALRRSTIGAEGFHGRVRDGIGWDTLAMTTRSSEQRGWILLSSLVWLFVVVCDGRFFKWALARRVCRCVRGCLVMSQADRAIRTG